MYRSTLVSAMERKCDVRQRDSNKKKSHISTSIKAISLVNAVKFRILSCQINKGTATDFGYDEAKMWPRFPEVIYFLH